MIPVGVCVVSVWRRRCMCGMRWRWLSERCCCSRAQRVRTRQANISAFTFSRAVTSTRTRHACLTETYHSHSTECASSRILSSQVSFFTVPPVLLVTSSHPSSRFSEQHPPHVCRELRESPPSRSTTSLRQLSICSCLTPVASSTSAKISAAVEVTGRILDPLAL